MNVKLVRSYRAKSGKVTFVYAVRGNAEQLAGFKAAQGEYYREDTDGTPLWFTTRFIGQTGKLLLTTNGNLVPDMSAFDQAASLASQYGGDLGQELAKTAAEALLGNRPVVSSTPATIPEDTDPPAGGGGIERL